MDFSITAYKGNSAMKLWEPLAAKAFVLTDNSHQSETLFFYDSPPENCSSSDAPVFVLIHGLGDEADTWRHLIPLLNSSGFRAIAPDLPGFGRSALRKRLSLKAYANAVIALIQTAVLPQNENPPPIFLAGSSLGALVAQEAALRCPHLTRGLVLIGGSIPGGPKLPNPLALAKRLFSRKWYRSYRKNASDRWDSLKPYYANLESLSPEDKDFLRQRVMARVESPTQEGAFFKAQRSVIRSYVLFSPLYAKKIKRHKSEILLVWGVEDKIMPLSSAHKFKALRSGIDLKIISDAGHLPQQEKPAEAAALMADFASRCL
ncbi:MAG: alpha/beta hydrolase [Treponema sp.]|nr:alpha/beta hydrolase [Treponema sp.]